MRTVAALYIDPKGPYVNIPYVDAWDEARDAKLYAGPHPVLAHPPCGPWSRLKHFCKHQDPGCGLRAVEQVQTFGGVLEHPKDSSLFERCELPRPGEAPDAFGGFTIAVDQCAWGHVSRKATWLYLVGAPMPSDVRTGGVPTHSVCNGRGQVLKDGTKRQRCTALQARITPPEFAEFLVRIARSVQQR